MKTTVSALALTGAIAVAALAGGIGAAEAGGKKGFKFHHHWGHNHHHHRIFVPRYGGCGFYKAKWFATGLPYWKKRYFLCKSGW